MSVDIDGYLRECVQIETMVLEEEFIRLPADMAYWNEVYAKAYKIWLSSKIDRETAHSQLTYEHRMRLEVANQKRITAAEVEANVLQDPRYTAARRAECDAESEKVRLHGVMEALIAKKEMLISIGAHIRKEMEGDPMIRARAALDREVKNNQ